VSAPRPTPHRWQTFGRELVNLHILEPARRKGELDALVPIGALDAKVTGCTVCGLLAVYANARLDDGTTQPLAAYGVDQDSLAVGHRAPSCEPLVMPAQEILS
jgi:hypothetical protein